MRLTLLASAMALTAVATPASAAVYVVSISGAVSGTSATTLCTPGPSCLPGASQRSDPYSNSFSRVIGGLNLAEGDNAFSFGSIYSGGLYSGTIVNNGGVLTGRDLTFSQQTCSPGQPTVGCQLINASARQFAVGGGVPEPATWALMLMGFGAVGYAMRRRRPVPVRVAFAR